MKISEEILERINKRRERIAQAIHDSDWGALSQNVALVLAVVFVAVVMAVLIFVLVWKILVALLGTLLGKIFMVPMVLFIFGLSYKMNLEDSRSARLAKSESATLDKWAKEMYDYVRDAMFLVFRAVSEYTNIVMPSRASAIEMTDNPYTMEDGYIVFNFLSKICGAIDINQLKDDLQQTLQQMHRAHELNGFSRDLVQINGSYYCPLQILGNPIDYGDHIQVSVVFATAQTIKLTHAHKLLNLDNIRARKHQGKQLYDDEF